jgi:hypothetical protein
MGSTVPCTHFARRQAGALRRALCRVPSDFDWQARPKNLSLLGLPPILWTDSQCRQGLPDGLP